MEIPSRIQIASVAAPGVEPVVEILAALAEAGRLPLATDAITSAAVAFKEDGVTSCHEIALALLVDLHNARQTGWSLYHGWFRGDAPHSWLENRRVAVDASMLSPDGEPVVMVMERAAYRRQSGSRPRKAYTPQDVATGQYEADMKAFGVMGSEKVSDASSREGLTPFDS